MAAASHDDEEDLILQTKDGSQCVSWKNRSLTYLGRDCSEIPVVLTKVYGRLAERVDFSFCCLTSLKGLSSFPVVSEVILDNNCLSDDVMFPENQRLTTLSLNKNLFQRLENLVVKLSTSYPKLEFLSLIGNPCSPFINEDQEDYRSRVISRFPRLAFLDSSAVKAVERRRLSMESSTKSDKTMILPFVVRPTQSMMDRLEEENDDDDDSHAIIESGVLALPSTSSSTAAYGKVRYRYTGKHSEGNRFIRNSQL